LRSPKIDLVLGGLVFTKYCEEMYGTSDAAYRVKRTLM